VAQDRRSRTLFCSSSPSAPSVTEPEAETARRHCNPPVDLDDSVATPQDLIDAAVLENQATLETELLDRALTLSPTGFEDLVIRLLEKMGYGRAGNVERTSAGGDAGVDGIISQDPLGLDRIYVQAKSCALDRTVAHASTSSPAPSWASKAIEASSSPPRLSPEAHYWKPSESTPASNSSTALAWPASWSRTASEPRNCTPWSYIASTRTSSKKFRNPPPQMP